MNKLKIILGIAVSAAVTGFAISSFQNVEKVFALETLGEAHHCSFVIPSDFVPGEESGIFINKNYPMESSSISYSVFYNGKDVLLTNREKEQNPETIETAVIDGSGKLTKKEYEELMSESYNSAYGEDVGFEVDSFENVTIDGYPGYKIVSGYKTSDEQMIHQTVYIILSRYRTFTITYQRADDDDCEELFEKSAGTIHVK